MKPCATQKSSRCLSPIPHRLLCRPPGHESDRVGWRIPPHRITMCAQTGRQYARALRSLVSHFSRVYRIKLRLTKPAFPRLGPSGRPCTQRLLLATPVQSRCARWGISMHHSGIVEPNAIFVEKKQQAVCPPSPLPPPDPIPTRLCEIKSRKQKKMNAIPRS